MSEYTHVEKPFLDQLAALGWTVIDHGPAAVPQDPAASLRDSFREWILPGVFREAVSALNPSHTGQTWLAERQLDQLLEQIYRLPARSLLEANEAFHALLFKAQVDENEVTGESDPVVQLIDFDHPERNRFHAINQFRVNTPGCVKSMIIPDIVLFVNGIPLVVVECKIGDATTANPMFAAYEQLLRYRNGRPETTAAGLREGELRLFHPNLLLVRSCGESADFGTITSGDEHFYAWKDAEAQPLSTEGGADPAPIEREQERLIRGLLTPEHLIDILRTATVFMETESGARIKVVCRYQQYRAARKVIERLRTGNSVEERSGVVWHTQGSGKSLTMVFVARMLRAYPDLRDYKIILVNDRVDLEEQLSRTAQLIGGRVNLISSTAALRSHLSSPASDVNMVLVHKFMERSEELPVALAEALGRAGSLPSAQVFGVVNPSERILLMIDEAHRTQGSDLGENLLAAFPNAARIAFTGTPLLTERHGERRTVRRFGKYIDTYKLMDAVEDGATLQILYEGRTADTAIYDKHGFDTKFEDLFRERTPEEIEAIKKKYGTSGDILEAEARIGAIARDLVQHYLQNIFPDGFKAQVVCHSKLAAVRYQKAIREALAEEIDRAGRQPGASPESLRRLSLLQAVVVVSADSTNELAAITHARNEARRMDAVKNFCRPFNLDDPEKVNTGIAFLIVCDMLITGFDAPIEQVMYLDKKLTEHSLLQAIARVNRRAGGKQRGFIVDYFGLANHLSQALTIYADADSADLQLGLRDRLSELPILQERYQRLLQHFIGNGVALIRQFAEGKLGDAVQEVRVIHEAVNCLEDIRRRADFEVYLKKFLQSLNLILPHPDGQEYRCPARRFGYLLRMAKERYKDESLSIAGAGEKVKALINEHLIELGIDPLIPPIELFSENFISHVQQHAGGNPQARASEMEHAIRKHCTIHFDEDPAFYRRLSEKLEALIEQHRENWELLSEGYAQLREEALAGRTTEIEGLSAEASVYWEFLQTLAYENLELPPADGEDLKATVLRIVALIQESEGILDFWRKPVQVRRLRGDVDTELLLARSPRIREQHERLAVELIKLAEKRQSETIS